jgi:hypothetical protein
MTTSSAWDAIKPDICGKPTLKGTPCMIPAYRCIHAHETGVTRLGLTEQTSGANVGTVSFKSQTGHGAYWHKAGPNQASCDKTN